MRSPCRLPTSPDQTTYWPVRLNATASPCHRSRRSGHGRSTEAANAVANCAGLSSVSGVSRIDEIADRYVDQAAELDPVAATAAGIAGYDDRMTDLTPDGFAARAELDRATIAALADAPADGERKRVAKEAMLERLGLAVEQYDAGDVTSQLNVIASWVQDVRQVFDLMPADGEEAVPNLVARMAAVPLAYQGLRTT